MKRRSQEAGRAVLIRTAHTLSRLSRGRKPFAGLLLLTDPARTPDPVALASRMPRGSAVIYRSFGALDALATATALRAVTRRRGMWLLIGADPVLARAVRADGLHLPERDGSKLPRLRARHPCWRFTVAAHSPRALRSAQRAGADAVLVSTVFPSRSPSAGRPLGPMRLAVMTRSVRTPVLGLGGVNARTAPRLVGTGAGGLAAIGAWTSNERLLEGRR